MINQTEHLSLDPYSVPLTGSNLIEASAGTGKTWTISLLYLRLILESEPALTVDQILVVTYTTAATEELRDRIRQRLVEALHVFETPDSPAENEYGGIRDNLSNPEEAVQRLQRAILSFDEAAVYTIHGFCQRALSERAFDAGLPFDSELLTNDHEIVQQLVDDYWRIHLQNASDEFLFLLKQSKITPDTLLNDIADFVGKPYLQVLENQQVSGCQTIWNNLPDVFHDVQESWVESQTEISQLLLGFDGLNKRSYTAEKITQWLEDIAVLCRREQLPVKLPEGIKKLTQSALEKGCKKGFSPPDHAFFATWETFVECWQKANECAQSYLNDLRLRLLRYLQDELPVVKQQAAVLSFDDLLLELQKALQSHPNLPAQLRQQYQVALIDEFQDTDPVQYAIFSNIYQGDHNNAVFLVGDPKQAIYSFRGGDIHTYLQAKSNTPNDNHYTLKKNWRSHAGLIQAFNHLYADCDNPFQDRGIEYVKVDAGDRIKGDLITPDKRTPLRFWQVIPSDEKPTAKQIRKDVAEAVAGDIVELLGAADQGNASIGDKAISGGDIAVLVRSHTEGDLIKVALNACGIASVQSSKDSIYETHEAAEIIILLTAIVEPQREDNVRRALVTELIGKTAEDLLAYEDDSNAWEDQLLNMQRWHYQWKEQGFLPMMRDLMRRENLYQHLMAYDDGERRITNVLHLSELIHKQSHKQSLSMEEVLRWLRQQQENASQKESELRLESDENLVKIVTIHKSKGLEYPIVYCPFVGLNGAAFKDKVFTFNKDGQPCLELGSPNAETHKKIKIREQQAEATRLLYVALTRAKYQCTVVCLPEPVYRNPDKTALGWLITNGETTASAKDKKVFHEAYHNNLEKLASDNRGIIKLDELPDVPANVRYQAKQTESELAARNFTANIKAQAQITSFSGLTAGAHAETPDYDDLAKAALIDLANDKNEFPRGATAGVALHEIFEHLDFIQPVTEQSNIVLNALNKWGFDSKHQDAASRLIENSLRAELFDDFSLNLLSNNKRLNEMEFYLPLQRLQIDDLKQILFKHLPAGQQHIRDALNGLYFEQVEGYMKGFIDLIFEHQGKYYLADYKSNSLPDYKPQSLLAVMADAHYYLQYLLYCVALHRYLKKHLPGYRWEKDMGGVYYLFIRGMDGDNDNGIFFDKPSLELIEALDALFVREVAYA